MDETKLINIQLIDRPVPPVRLQFDEEEIKSLCDSIQANGIIVPLLVRPVGARYEIIDGDCRLEAANRLRLREAPCVVRDATDSETFVLRMLANLDRNNPDLVSEAVSFARALDSGIITFEELARKLHRSNAWLDDRLAIAGMSDYMQDALRQKKCALGVALEYQKITDERVRRMWFEAALRDGSTIETARGAVYQFEKQKHVWEDAAISPDQRELPPVPEVTKIDCAACGISEEPGQMRWVRIHARGCPQ